MSNRKMQGNPRPLRRAEAREDERLLTRVTKTLEADLSQEQEQKESEFSLGYQHGLKTALRLIDIERGVAMRP